MIRMSLLGLVLVPIALPSSAAAYEWRIAKPGSYPGGLRCAKTTGSIAYFQARGDKVWVMDTPADGVSAIAKWPTASSVHGFVLDGTCGGWATAGN